MSKESFKQETKSVRHNARMRGVARTLDMRGAYNSGRYVDTSMQAAAMAIYQDGVIVRRDIAKASLNFTQSLKKRLK